MTIKKSYSTFEVKSFTEDAEKVIIRGLASTPTPDRSDDIVVPEGAKFNLPIPFLWQHNSNDPMGHVIEANITAKGIEIVAEVLKGVTSRIDEHIKLIKAGLVRGLSIGFRGLEVEEIPRSWGVKFNSWEWLELSAVTIPANAEANIFAVKKFDDNPVEVKASEATIIKKPKDNTKSFKPGVSGNTIKKVKIKGENANLENEKMSLTLEITKYKDTLAAKKAEQLALLQKSTEGGETFDEAEADAYDVLTAEIKSLTDHIARLSDAIDADVKTAAPVTGSTSKSASDSRATAAVRVKNTQTKEPGIDFAQFTLALAQGKGNLMQAAHIAETRFKDNDVVNMSLKAAVAAGTTTDPAWAGPLVDYTRMANDFVEFLRPSTILGKFGTGGIPALRRIPFNVTIPTQLTGGEGYWVGEGQAKPLTSFEFGNITLGMAKVANIAVLTDELIRNSTPAADVIVRDQLAEALRARLDTDFIDPTKAAVAGVSPASITNGVTPIPSSGSDADAIRTDIQAVFASYLTANLTPATGVWIMNSLQALALSLMTNPLGQAEFPGITMGGGTFNGMPVIVSQFVPAGTVILANASDIMLADDGGVAVDASREASLEMTNTPTHNSTTPTAAQLVSMFQTNSVAIRAERWINWGKRRPQAVAYLTGVTWGGANATT